MSEYGFGLPKDINFQRVALEETFSPFASDYKTLPLNLVELYDSDDIRDYIVGGVEFSGAKGYVALQVDSREPSGITPLGPAFLRKKYQDGSVIVEEVPLILGVDFLVNSADQLEHLKQFMAEVMVGRRKLYMPIVSLLGGGQQIEDYLESIAAHGQTKLWNQWAYSKSGEEYTIVLPQDFDKLSRVKMKFVEGGNFLQNLRRSTDDK